VPPSAPFSIWPSHYVRNNPSITAIQNQAICRCRHCHQRGYACTQSRQPQVVWCQSMMSTVVGRVGGFVHSECRALIAQQGASEPGAFLARELNFIVVHRQLHRGETWLSTLTSWRRIFVPLWSPNWATAPDGRTNTPSSRCLDMHCAFAATGFPLEHRILRVTTVHPTGLALPQRRLHARLGHGLRPSVPGRLQCKAPKRSETRRSAWQVVVDDHAGRVHVKLHRGLAEQLLGGP
jgi:hypothetical protein